MKLLVLRNGRRRDEDSYETRLNLAVLIWFAYHGNAITDLYAPQRNIVVHFADGCARRDNNRLFIARRVFYGKRRTRDVTHNAHHAVHREWRVIHHPHHRFSKRIAVEIMVIVLTEL